MKERLSITLTLTLGGTAHDIPGGNVRGFSLEMTSYGVEGWVEFVVQDDQGRGGKYTDEVLADFVKPDLATVSLAIEAAHVDTDTTPSDAAIKTGGVVLERTVREEVYERMLTTDAVLSRRYRVRFADPASALWRQHFPCDLLAKKSFKEAIEAHKGTVSVTYDWETIATQLPLVFFHLDPGAGASFYDLVLWYVQGRQGVFTFDQAEQTYSITKEKDTSGTEAELPREDVAAMISVFPEVPRHKPRVLCSTTESTRKETIDNANAADGVTRDVLIRTPIAKEVDDRVTLEKSRPLLPGREVEIELRRFPTIAMAPGSLVSISEDGGHSPDLIAATEPFRVWRLSVQAGALDDGPEETYGETAAKFSLSMTARLEAKSEAVVRLPSFVAPRFPGYLEGKIISEVGADEDITYQILTDADTSVDYYRVKIPLFDNQEIYAPYEPYAGSGTLYLPIYKGERVLVAFDLDRALIHGLLDWRADARVVADGQGQHLFLGKKAKSSTSVLHDYQEDKPVLRILRTNDKDTALIRIEEGKMTLKIEETK